MRLDKGLEVLEIMNTLGDRKTLYPTLIHDKEHVILVDCGIPGSLTTISQQLKNASTDISKLTHVIITHQDFDHMGGAWSIKNQDTDDQIEVLVHEGDAEYIEGIKEPIKLTPDFRKKLESMVSMHSYDRAKEINTILANYHVKVSKALKDKEILSIGGGIEVIHTPGITPGHVCLYVKKSKTLIAGDLLTVTNGMLYGPNFHNAIDYKSAIQSLEKLKSYTIKRVICYHGGVYTHHVNKRIHEIFEMEWNELKNKK